MRTFTEHVYEPDGSQAFYHFNTSLFGAMSEGLENLNEMHDVWYRPVALGRKNYLFAGSHDAAQRGAVVYSLLATCKKHDVHLQSWLSDTLARIPTHPHKEVHELLPNYRKNSKT